MSPSKSSPAAQAGLGPFAADPQQASAAGVDLIDQRQIMVAALPLDLVDADRFDARQIAVNQAPADGVPHRIADVLPGGVEHAWPLPARRAAAPSRPETIDSSSSAATCRWPKEPARRRPRNVGNRLASARRRTPRRSATAARTRSGAASADRSRAGACRSRNRPAGHWPAGGSALRGSAAGRRRPSGEFRRRTTCGVRRD